ncbi:hypothetical protein AMTR_s00008p00267020 [Amborella trichopoda]|uniref:Uncharacterized protein n=1 Tax=Amborella trichopoda TaxID=13333 RepID=W1NIY1_AMBTC|nr:hypothetical protein AMTR_s00008p00267020 [Amborella trichopoda]
MGRVTDSMAETGAYQDRHESDIHLGKLRQEFTRVPHRVKGMMGGHAPRISISAASRLSHRGKAPMEEGSVSRGPGVSASVQGESSHPSNRGAV